MPELGVSVISIHDTKGAGLCDLRDVLGVLQEQLNHWVWCITEFDAIGHGEQASQVVAKACTQVDRAGHQGLWLSSRELTDLATQTAQTINGTFLAFPRAIDRTKLAEADLSIAGFPSSPAALAIGIVDSTYLEVYAKDPGVVLLLRRGFRNVRDEDPRKYFEEG